MVFGLGIGISVGGIVLAGGWVFAVALAAAVFTGAREYFELVRSHGITEGMTPPPRYVSRVCSVICRQSNEVLFLVFPRYQTRSNIVTSSTCALPFYFVSCIVCIIVTY